MNQYFKTMYLAVVVLLLGSLSIHADDTRPLSLVVMDPLAAPLSCPCVEGYAQRKYEALAEHLESALGRPVKLVFAEALGKALKETKGNADLIIGKDSVVRSDAAEAKIELSTLGHLTDQSGSTKQRGLIVVAASDPAQEVSDLGGYDVIFGPRDCEEKHAAAMKLLTSVGVTIPSKLTIDQACSDGAAKVVERGAAGKTAAVISSYAEPLLEGCGTIKKGDLRVVGETKPVPFITAFATGSVAGEDRKLLSAALLDIAEQPAILESLETLVGFLPPGDESDSAKKKLRLLR